MSTGFSTNQVKVRYRTGRFDLIHHETQVPFPLVFDRISSATKAANQVEALCDWNAYVTAIRAGDPSGFCSGLNNSLMQSIIAISDACGGEMQLGDVPLEPSRIALHYRKKNFSAKESD